MKNLEEIYEERAVLRCDFLNIRHYNGDAGEIKENCKILR